MPDRRKAAVLISGRGSNLAALIDAARAPDYPADIVCVISDNPAAGGLAHARAAGIEAAVVDRKAFRTKAEFEAALHGSLEQAGADIVCFAGFMRLLSADFVEAWRDRLLNIHPSLLPLFPGLDTHARALAAGVRLHGATVHFVRAETDGGPIVAQGAVPVLADDTAERLASRVLALEHRLYPMALGLVASGRAIVSGEQVKLSTPLSSDRMLLSPEPDALT